MREKRRRSGHIGPLVQQNPTKSLNFAPCAKPGPGSFRTEGPVSPTWDRSLGLPQNSDVREPVSLRSGPVAPRLPQLCSLGDRSLLSGTGHESKTLRTHPKLRFPNFLGRKTFYDPLLSVEQLGTHPITRTPQFAQVQCVTPQLLQAKEEDEEDEDRLPCFNLHQSLLLINP
uniref:Uncharacterized protein n=1 Tax=Ananas comosus var. bracteatus TaxID=296719 RepID=A0A6V7P910_ANACO|nr:unnamed protein product [Ananas comosus var. bracteatus]